MSGFASSSGCVEGYLASKRCPISPIATRSAFRSASYLGRRRKTAFWIEKSASRFSLAAERFQSVAGLETLHRFLVLRYELDHGGSEELIVPLELYSLLMDLADGVQILDAFSDDVFANLGVFTRRLAQEDERRLNGWNPVESDVVWQLGVVDARGRQTITLSSGAA